MHLIMAPHLKLFSICGVTGLPRSSANIWRAPGLAQARPHDAIHLPSIAMHGSSVNTAGMTCTSNTLTLCSCQTGWRVIKICQHVLHHLFVWGRWMATQGNMQCGLISTRENSFLHCCPLMDEIISQTSMRGQWGSRLPSRENVGRCHCCYKLSSAFCYTP